jgi:hypothetical protein
LVWTFNVLTDKHFNGVSAIAVSGRYIPGMTWGSQGCDYEDGCLLGCNAL